MSAHRRAPVLALLSGLAVAASMAMLSAIVAVHGTGFVLVMPLFTAAAVVFALGTQGCRGRRSDAAVAALLTALSGALAAGLAVGAGMAIQFRMDLHHVLRALGPDMTWAIWRARQDLWGDLSIAAGIALAVWLALRTR